MTVPKRHAAALMLAGVLASCTVGPDFEPPAATEANAYLGAKEEPPALAEVAPTQRIALGQRISGSWWQLFRSAELDEVLRQAIAGNQNLAAARSTLAEAREAVAQASGAQLPQLDLAASGTRQKTNFANSGFNFPHATFNYFSVGPTVSYDLDLFGGTRRLVEERGALAEYQGHQLAAAYLTLTGDAVTEAIAIASTRAQIRATEDIIRDDESNLELVQREVAAGIATQLDIETARSQLESDRALLPSLNQQLSVARHALSVLAGRMPAEWTPPDFELEQLTLPAELPVSLPSELARQRPDILAAESQLHAASAAVGVATAQLYPNITLSAAVAQQALSPDKLFLGTGTVWALAGNLTAPLFHGGSLEAQRRGAADAFDTSYARYKQTVLTAFGQVADVLQALTHDAQEVAAQQRALAAARASLTLTRRAYSLGSVGILQVLDAERLYAQARLGQVRAIARRYLDTTQLFLAMGGGWWDSTETFVSQASATH